MPRHITPVVLAGLALTLGLAALSQAANLGTYTGKTFDVPQAKCHPDCKILGG